MNDVRTQSLIVDHLDVRGAIAKLSVPASMSAFGEQLVGIVDTIAIGSLGPVALAGATAANTVFMVLLCGVAGFYKSVGILAAQRIGAGDLDGYARTARSGGLVALFAAVLLLACAIVTARSVLALQLGAIDSVGTSAQYLILRAGSLVALAVSGTLVSSLGAAGNRRLGVYVLLLVNVIHIPLLLWLGLGWWSGTALGVPGAGIASLSAEIGGCIFACCYVRRRPAYAIFHCRESAPALSRETAWKCTRIGIPEGLFLSSLFISDTVIVGFLATLGATAVAAYRVLLVASDITFVVPNALQYATQIVIGQRLGARDCTGARIFIARAQTVTLAITSALGGVVALLSWPIAYVLTLDRGVASVAALPLAAQMAVMPLKGWAMVAVAPIRASGNTRFAMLLGVSSGAIAITLSWLAVIYAHLGLYGVAAAWVVVWALRAAITQSKLTSNDWMENPC